MTRTWLGLLALALAGLTLTACPGGGTEGDGGMNPDGGGDLRRRDAGACKEEPAPTADLAVAPTGQKVNPGDIGTACTQNTDCKQGPAPVCWTQSLLNNAGLVRVPGGYCGSTCAQDADCGPDHACIDFGTDSGGRPIGKGCIAGCGDAVTCRKPDYGCVYLEQRGDMIITGCIPNANFTCNPEQGTCRDRLGLDGGCWRQAIDDDKGGICLSACSLEDTSCAGGRQCLYLDFPSSGIEHGAFRGLLCFPDVDEPKAEGETCQFTNECTADTQCDNGAGGTMKCQRLCDLKGKAVKCKSTRFCEQAFPTCEAGLCR